MYTIACVAEWLRRYVQVVVLFEGAGSSPVACKHFAFEDHGLKAKNQEICSAVRKLLINTIGHHLYILSWDAWFRSIGELQIMSFSHEEYIYFPTNDRYGNEMY